MHQFFINSGQVDSSSVRIEGKDVNHIKNVLRMKVGNEFMATDENEMEYLCRIETMEADRIVAAIERKAEVNRELSGEIYLFQCLPKGDKMELIIEKAVELGACEVVPVASKRCVVKIDPKKEPAKLKRWSAIAESAAKQSKRGKIPQVHSIVKFDEALKMAGELDLVAIPYENAKGMDSLKDVLRQVHPGENMKIGVFIGPEGGFEEAEVQRALEAGVTPVSLGSRILRTETAGLTMLSLLMLKLECGEENDHGNIFG